MHQQDSQTGPIMDIADASSDTSRDVVDTLIEQWREQRPDLDPEAMGIVGRILSLSRVLEQRASTQLKPFGLHYSDFDVLATLRRVGPPYSLTPKQLMESVLITSGAMTALLERLSKKELIRRGVDKSDGRIKTAILTEEGKKLVEDAVAVRFSEATDAISGLQDDEAKSLADSLRRLQNTIHTPSR